MDCTWGQWAAWGSCTVTCGGETQTTTRSHEEEQQNGGSACTGGSNKTQSCNTAICNPGISQHNQSVCVVGIIRFTQFVSSPPSKTTTIISTIADCTDHSTTGNCAALLTQLAELDDTALVQQLCEGDGGLGSTLCQRTCHEIFYTYGITGTFC